MSAQAVGKVFLVGAGPGDPELLTLKAARLISEADVILYDKLVNSKILELAKTGCELIYVGKEPRVPCKKQEEINSLLIEAARRRPMVVRLKGGDPFVFGRGGEECLDLRAAGIPYEVVPGISSSIAGPAYAGIPVTHRKVATSFAVITGHESPEKNEATDATVDWSAFRGVSTLMILMGVGHRQQIANGLIASGRLPSEPCAFVENATTPRQRVILSTLGEVSLNPPEVKTPTVWIVGEVTRLAEMISWYEPQTADSGRVETVNLSAPERLLHARQMMASGDAPESSSAH